VSSEAKTISMNIRITLIALLLTCWIASGHAQLTKTFHHSFEIDSVDLMDLKLEGEYEISYWAGNTILTETNVELYDASPNIFKHFIKVGRYDLEFKENGRNAIVKHSQLNRKPIYTANGQCWEVVKMKVFLPDNFEKSGEHQFSRVSEKAK